jgi:hypothetical protein
MGSTYSRKIVRLSERTRKILKFVKIVWDRRKKSEERESSINQQSRILYRTKKDKEMLSE